MKIVKYMPLFFYLLVAYNILIFIFNKSGSILTSTIININLISGALFILNTSNILIIIGVVFLYIEIFKSTRTSVASIIDHTFSMITFSLFLIEFIVIESAGTSSFFILTLMALLDVIAGFTVTISTARRDWAVDRE